MRISQEQLAILTALCDLPTAPYCEQHVIAWVLAWAAGRANDVVVRRDPAGNVYLDYLRRGEGGDAAPVVIEAHMDHPGFIVAQMDGAGGVRAVFRGGVRVEHFKDAAVRFWVNDPPAVRSVKPVAAKGKWVRTTVREVVPPAKPGDAMRVVLDSPGETFLPGTLGMWDLPDAAVDGELFSARVCDDLAGCAAALCMMDELIAGDVAANVTVLLSRAEEVGFAGVLAAAKNGWVPAGARVIGLETSKGSALAPQGAGPIVRAGDRTATFSTGLTQHIVRAGEGLAKADPAFKFQRKLMDGGTCNSTAFLAFGYDATGVCVSLGNYHNMTKEGETGWGDGSRAGPGIGSETIHLGDFAGEVKLLVEAVKTMGAYEPGVGFLRRRLEKLHEEEQVGLLYEDGAREGSVIR